MKTLGDTAAVGLDHKQIEIEDRASIEAAFARVRPTVVINTAAFHNVEACEREPQRAFGVNTIAVDLLAAACARIDAVFVTMSSDYVFEGTKGSPYNERDETAPLNVYGVSKRAGELCAHRHGSRYVVFRTSGMYGIQTSTQKGHTFVDRLLRQVQAGETPRIVTDMTVSTSYAPDVASTIRRVLERAQYGIVHVTNAGGCSWFDFAQEALRVAGVRAHITPIATRDLGSATRRPAYSVLAHDALASMGIEMPSWQDALRRYIAERTVRA